ncbi:MAG: hypothetical protein GY765_29595, partial [bacterium]|nr:hypothetical protein [bacterium]
NFFELGGNSLNMMPLVSNIHKVFNVKISLKELFDNPVIQLQAAIIKKAGKDIYRAIEATEKREFHPLSSAQQRMYIQQQMDLNSISYNMPQLLQLETTPDKEKFSRIFNTLIRRHEGFRTSFEMSAETPVQRIHPHVPFAIRHFDLENIEQAGGEARRNREIERIIRKFISPFDLMRPPFLRVGFIKLSEKKYILMLDMHHIIADGVSMSVLIKEFADLYTDIPLAPLPIQYKDYSQWQNKLLATGAMKK